MQKPVISSYFTVDDIHKLREYHYETTKNMPPKERRDLENKEGMDIYHKQMAAKAVMSFTMPTETHDGSNRCGK